LSQKIRTSWLCVFCARNVAIMPSAVDEPCAT
jgi:hypothetical protein